MKSVLQTFLCIFLSVTSSFIAINLKAETFIVRETFGIRATQLDMDEVEEPSE